MSRDLWSFVGGFAKEANEQYDEIRERQARVEELQATFEYERKKTAQKEYLNRKNKYDKLSKITNPNMAATTLAQEQKISLDEAVTLLNKDKNFWSDYVRGYEPGPEPDLSMEGKIKTVQDHPLSKLVNKTFGWEPSIAKQSYEYAKEEPVRETPKLKGSPISFTPMDTKKLVSWVSAQENVPPLNLPEGRAPPEGKGYTNTGGVSAMINKKKFYQEKNAGFTTEKLTGIAAKAANMTQLADIANGVVVDPRVDPVRAKQVLAGEVRRQATSGINIEVLQGSDGTSKVFAIDKSKLGLGNKGFTEIGTKEKPKDPPTVDEVKTFRKSLEKYWKGFKDDGAKDALKEYNELDYKGKGTFTRNIMEVYERQPASLSVSERLHTSIQIVNEATNLTNVTPSQARALQEASKNSATRVLKGQNKAGDKVYWNPVMKTYEDEDGNPIR